jgi:predicted RNA binding protein YcfA (HicA-like mRNA interferase family)
MPRIPGISQKDAERVLRKAGFKLIRQGKHVIMSDGIRIVTIPRHNPINSFTMGKIAKDAGLTPQGFLDLL